MKNTVAIFLGIGLFTSMQMVMAAPNDAFLIAYDFNQPTDAALSITTAVDAVNDRIDIFDFREKEGIEDKSAGDYQGFHLRGDYQFHPQWAVEATFWTREIEYSLDSNQLHSYLVGIRYQPHFNLHKNDALALRLSLWGNWSDQLSKTTPTRVNQYLFNQVHVYDPKDSQIQLDGIFSRKLDPMNQINFFTSLSYSQVDIGHLNIQASRQGCLMNVTIQTNNQYSGQLAQPCTHQGIVITDLNISGDATEFGLDVTKDLNYDSYSAAIGASWNWRYRAFESQISYQYQYLWRQDIDERVNQFGHSPLKDNHTIGAKFSYDLRPNLTAFLRGELYQHNFVGQIPFLYNGVTASRLDKRYGLASLGIEFNVF